MSLRDSLDIYLEWGNVNNMMIRHRQCVLPLNNNEQREAGQREIVFVIQFNYLGIILDDTMSLGPNFRMVKRNVKKNKILVLSKLRKYVTERTALCVYEQAVLPYFDYSGFILTSCTMGHKNDPQSLQNNALHIVKNCYIRACIRTDRLHCECNILGLEQRRRIQLLKLMYIHSKDESNIKVCTSDKKL